jgi:hypothetical protein
VREGIVDADGDAGGNDRSSRKGKQDPATSMS